MRVVVVEHEPGCPPDRLAGWLAEAGVHLEICRPYAGDELPSAREADGLVVLGGQMGANDDAVAPWLPAVRTLLADAVVAGTPVLGVCLGAQLLAVACGGRVEVGAAGIEAGVVDVQWRPEAAADPLVGALPGPFPGPSMHQDAIVALPADAVWLGETAAYPHQAFRVGGCAWGVQFHPEVSPPHFAGWAEEVGPRNWERWGVDGDEAVDQLRRRDAEVAAAGRALAHGFAVVAAEAAGRRGRSSGVRTSGARTPPAGERGADSLRG